MFEEKRQQLNDLNRELLVANTDYEELKKKLYGLGEKIFKLKVEINNQLDEET